MVDLLLWKRLSANDFNAINGLAAPSGTGGGAMHIALGTNTATNDVRSFLGVTSNNDVTIDTKPWPGHHVAGALTFGTNAARNYEWRIADQAHHRHPAWSTAAGFPAVFNPANPPVTIVARIAGEFHARFTDAVQFDALYPPLAGEIRGVAPLHPAWVATLGLSANTALDDFVIEEAAQSGGPDFDPKDIEDARRRVFSEILRRQGQTKFRTTVLDNYGGVCAVTGCSDHWVVEAAHISPYRGPETNHPTNGLPLRADIHTLFDLGLISIEPTSHKVKVSSLLKDTTYQGLQDRPLAKGKVAPSQPALSEHFARFRA